MPTIEHERARLRAVAGVVKDQVQAALDLLAPRIKAQDDRIRELEAALAARPAPEKGEKGDSVTAEQIYPLIAAKHSGWLLEFERRAQDVLLRQLERIQQPKDGKDADPDQVAEKVIAKLELKGTRTDIKRLCAELVEAEVAKLPPPKDGKDAEPITDDQVAGAVAKYLEANPVRNGKDADPVTDDQVDAAVRKTLEPLYSSWALDFEKRAQELLQRAIDRMPKPKDGADGLSFADLDVEMLADGRTLRFFAEADGRKVEKTVRLDHVVDRGVHKEEGDYLKGDGVTWGGSFWIAQKDAPKGRPGQYNRDWRLAVKRGRDGGTK